MTDKVDGRVTLAKEYLAGIRRQHVDELPPSVLMRECAELRRQLAQVLGAYEDMAREAGALAEVRAVLAAFDWEFDDRQLALERIDRIAGES